MSDKKETILQLVREESSLHPLSAGSGRTKENFQVSSLQSLPPQAPLLAFSSLGKYGEQQIFVSLGDGRLYYTELQEMHNSLCFGCYTGWVFIVDRSHTSCFLVSLKSRQKVHVPPPPRQCRSIFSVVLTSDPSKPNCKILSHCSSGSLYLCNLIKKRWMKIDHKFGINEKIGSITSCNGKIYAWNWPTKLMIINCDQHPVKVELLEVERIPFMPMCCVWECLLESLGELFVISGYHFGLGTKMYTCEVYKMDFLKKKWERVCSLGDRAFFACPDSCGMSCSASRAGITGNSIYFIKEDDPKIYRFDMADKSISVEVVPPETNKPSVSGVWIKASD